MAAHYVLDLDPDLIRLVRLDGDGQEELGVFPTQSGELAAQMRALLGDNGLLDQVVELCLPESQILYTRVPAPGPDNEARAEQVRRALHGLTPYDVDDILYDWEADGDMAKVAAVAVETIEEATTFAEALGLAAGGVTAAPTTDAFPRPPRFIEHDIDTVDLAFSSTRADQQDTDAPPEPDPEEDQPTGEIAASGEPPDAAPTPSGDADPVRNEAPVAAAADRTDGPDEAPAPRQAQSRPADATKDAEARDPSSAEALRTGSDGATQTDAAHAPDPDPDPEPVPDAEPGESADQEQGDAAPDMTEAPRITTGTGFQPEGVPDQADVAATLSAINPPTAPRSSRLKPPDRTGYSPVIGRRMPQIAIAAALVAVAGVSLWMTFGRGGPPQLVRPDVGPVVFDTAPPAPVAPPLRRGNEPLAPEAFAPTPEELADSDDTMLGPPPVDTAPPERQTMLAPSDGDAPLVGQALWQLAMAPPQPPVHEGAPSIDLAAFDPVTPATDAFALPRLRQPDTLPTISSGPAADGAAAPETDTPAIGATTPPPGGVALNLGGQDDAGGSTDLADVPVVPGLSADVRPRQRPEGLVDSYQRARFGGRTLEELAGLRPRPRPESPQSAPDIDEAPTDRAVARSMAPRTRPADMDQIVAAVRRTRSAAQAEALASASTAAINRALPQTAPEPDPPSQPRLPTRAEVAREATVEDAIRLNRMNLIGVFGSASDRRAIVRMPSGRLVRLKVGDRLDGGSVAAISDNALSYTKGGRTLTLAVPSG